MENKEKLQRILQHWIEHTKSHVEEFERWRQTAATEGESAIADHIAEAISAVKKANDALESALQKAGGPAHGDDHHHHHHHH
ncbi:MAG: hypothetical protein ACK5PS_10135 [Desulfopila sp.]